MRKFKNLYIPITLKKIMYETRDSLREIERINNIRHDFHEPPKYTMNKKQIGYFMHLIKMSIWTYRAEVGTTPFAELRNKIRHECFDKAFCCLLPAINYIIHNNEECRGHYYELLSDAYFNLVVYKDRITKLNGVTRMAKQVFNWLDGRNGQEYLWLVERAIYNYLRKFFEIRVWANEKRNMYYYTFNSPLEYKEEGIDYWHDAITVTESADFKALNPFRIKEVLLLREQVADSLLNLHNLIELRIPKEEFGRLTHAYLRHLIKSIGGYETELKMDFNTQYTIFKIKEYLLNNNIGVDTIVGKTYNDELPIYPSFTKILADKLGVQYEDGSKLSAGNKGYKRFY